MTHTGSTLESPHRVRKSLLPFRERCKRFLPASVAIPTEMLPILDKPLIQYAVEDAYDAGIREMIFVSVRHKRAIEVHLDTAFQLVIALENAEKIPCFNCFLIANQAIWHAFMWASHVQGASVTRYFVQSHQLNMNRLQYHSPLT